MYYKILGIRYCIYFVLGTTQSRMGYHPERYYTCYLYYMISLYSCTQYAYSVHGSYTKLCKIGNNIVSSTILLYMWGIHAHLKQHNYTWYVFT